MANLIGTGLNQVPTNGLLGNMAFQNKEAVSMDLLGVSGNLIVNGRLGVGTNAPDYPFVVLSSTATPTAWFKHTGGTDSSIILGDPSTISNECGIYGRTTGAFNFVNTTGGRFVWKNTGGTEYMRLDASGNLGIGTSSPSSGLELLRAGDALLTLTGNTASGNVAGIDFKRNTGTVNASIRSQSVGGNDMGEIYFSTRPSAGSLTERMRLDSAGTLGIGVTPKAWQVFPVNTIQIGGAMAVSGYTASGNRQANIWCNAYLNTSGVLTYMNTDAASAYRQLTGVHAWYSAPSGTADTALTFTQTMTLNASGQLGIGTASPSEFLHINSASAVQVATRYVNSNTTSVTVGAAADGSAFFYQAAALPFIVFTNAAERMRITSGGDVGIGTSSPLSGLHFNRASSGVVTPLANALSRGFIISDSAATNAGIQIGINGGSASYLQARNNTGASASAIDFAINPLGGNVGIGTSSPVNKLTVAGSEQNISVFNTVAGSTATISWAGIRFYGYSQTQDGWSASIEAGNSQANNVGGYLRFLTHSNTTGTDPVERMRITNTGNLQLGTASLATTATDGFPYIPTCAGTPTGTPTAITGYAPMVVDSTNNKLYVYVGGAWQAMN